MKPFPRVTWVHCGPHWLLCVFGSRRRGTVGGGYAGDVTSHRYDVIAESAEVPEQRFPRRWMAKRFIERAASEHWYREQMRVAAMNDEERAEYDREQERLRALGDEVAKYFEGVK